MIQTVAEINRILAAAHSYTLPAVLYSVANTLSAGLLGVFCTGPVEAALEQVRVFVAEQNVRVYHPAGLHLSSPADFALMHVRPLPLPLPAQPLSD